MTRVRVLADQHVYRLSQLMTQELQLDTFDPDKGLPSNVSTYDALIIRTVTPVNRETLPEKGCLRLIATASVGLDHIDRSYVEPLGIKVISAAGCNARAVAEYVATMFLYVSLSQRWNYHNLTVGIVGVGHTGGAVYTLMEKLGVTCHLYDPPRARRDPGFTSCTREQVLDSDVLTLHVPLTKDHEEATYHWLDHAALSQGPRKLLIQASRGGVVDEQALLKAMRRPHPLTAVIDVWEGEPLVNSSLLEKASVATPHIAGYSQQAKIMATITIMEQLCACFDLPSAPVALLKNQWMKALIPPDPEAFIDQLADDPYPECEPCIQEYLAYDVKLRQGRLDPAQVGSVDQAVDFNTIRTTTPYRFEYSSWKPYADRLDAWPLWKLLVLTA